QPLLEHDAPFGAKEGGAETGRLIGRALSASLRAYALLATDSANRINQLPNHQFAQLDAHN
ncbi:MAG: hypothetical protein N2Z69_00785, partial [Methylophilaceae bacterium]|nr:hypothetical protein [Methylophilaceae bacterium]